MKKESGVDVTEKFGKHGKHVRPMADDEPRHEENPKPPNAPDFTDKGRYEKKDF